MQFFAVWEPHIMFFLVILYIFFCVVPFQEMGDNGSSQLSIICNSEHLSLLSMSYTDTNSLGRLLTVSFSIYLIQYFLRALKSPGPLFLECIPEISSVSLNWGFLHIHNSTARIFPTSVSRFRGCCVQKELLGQQQFFN